jgi:hypothetical protein
MGGEQWDNAVPIVYIGRPTVEKDHRRSGVWAAFEIGNIQCLGSD